MVKPDLKKEMEKRLLSFCRRNVLKAPLSKNSDLYMKTGHWVSSILGTTPRVCIQGVNSIWGCSRDWACGEGRKWPHNCILPLLLVIICLWLCLIKLGGKKAKACMCFSKQRWTKGQETSGVLFSVVLMLQKRDMSRNYDKVLRCLTPRLAPWGHTYPDKAQPQRDGFLQDDKCRQFTVVKTKMLH